MKAIRDAIIGGVAPFTGAWIEISRLGVHHPAKQGRSLHGSVD